jgi:hypothetical protein
MKRFFTHTIFIRFCFTIIIIGLSVASLASQTNLISEKYLKIKPVVSTRDDVEKLLAKGNLKRYNVIYQATDETISIDYSSGGCDSSNKKWGVPEWTAEKVFYVPRDEHPLRLRDVILNLSKFKRRQSGDVIVHIEYYNEDAGISVTYDKKEKIVTDITISPTLEQKKRFACVTEKLKK